MSDIFISYARDNQPEAQRFVDALKAAGYKVWWDTALHAGESFDMRIEAAIKAAKAVVVLWSEKSVSSRWVRAEATMADRLGKLVPVRIGPCDLPIMFELTHTEELSNWQGESDTPLWQRFLESLSEVVGAAPEIQTTAPVVTTPAKPSVLVLPFSNMSRDPEQEYFAME